MIFAIGTLIVGIAAVVSWRNWRIAESAVRRFAAEQNMEVVELKRSWIDHGPFEPNWNDVGFHQIARATLRDKEGVTAKAWLLIASGRTSHARTVKLMWHDQYRNGERE